MLGRKHLVVYMVVLVMHALCMFRKQAESDVHTACRVTQPRGQGIVLTE